MSAFRAYINIIPGFCAVNCAHAFVCDYDKYPKNEGERKKLALEFVVELIRDCSGSRLFIGDIVKLNKREEGKFPLRVHESMQLCIVPYLPKKFSFNYKGKCYSCSVQTSRRYLNYNSGNTVRHTIISWTKKKIKK